MQPQLTTLQFWDFKAYLWLVFYSKVFGNMFSFETKSGELIVLQSCDFADEIRQLK